MSEEATTTNPAVQHKKRWPKHAVWIGLVTTFVGMLSYVLYFYQFPTLRDFPVLNLPIVMLGLLLTGAGCWQVFAQRGSIFGKTLASLGLLLALGFAGLFNAYIFFLSYQLPESTGAPTVETAVPDFTLLDQTGKEVKLSNFRGKKVVLVFYRGDW